MDRVLDLILQGGLRLPLFNPAFMALDRNLPRSELLALLALRRRGDATMSELAGDLGAPLSTVTGIGTRLARRGLAERHRHSEDRRVILVRLTPVGRALATSIRSHVDRLIAQVQSVLTPGEMEQLLHLMQRALQAFQPAAAETDFGAATHAAKRIPIDE